MAAEPSSSSVEHRMVAETSSPPEEKEHWSVRLKKIPFPWLRKNEKNPEDEWWPWDNRPNPYRTIQPTRKSQRLINKMEKKKQPGDCILYPPHYGRRPKEKKKKKANPFLLPEKFTFPPPSPKDDQFTEAELEEMREDLEKKTDLAKKTQFLSRLKKYQTSSDYVATYPVLTEVNDDTLAIVGWNK